MVIRDEQMHAFDEACWRRFEHRMIARLITYFPERVCKLDAAQLHCIVRLAHDKAQAHALTHERSIALYLDLMCMLGSGFDTDPQYPWAAAILADRSFPGQADRIDTLHSRAWLYIEQIWPDFESPDGTEGRHRLIAALDRSPESLCDISPRLRAAFPHKAEAIGEDGLQLLITSARERACRYRLEDLRSFYLFALLMFVVGAGFDSDPFYPWAAALSDEESLYKAACAALRDRSISGRERAG